LKVSVNSRVPDADRVDSVARRMLASITLEDAYRRERFARAGSGLMLPKRFCSRSAGDAVEVGEQVAEVQE
jgi:hypothetical protein